jgi:hypothetical protein
MNESWGVQWRGDIIHYAWWLHPSETHIVARECVSGRTGIASISVQFSPEKPRDIAPDPAPVKSRELEFA